MVRLFLWTILIFVAVRGAVGAEPDAGPRPTPNNPTIDYSRDILPILSGKCFTCHGPDREGRKAKLRLDQRDQALRKSHSGVAPIVPGKAKDSEVIRRIFAQAPDEVMPPPHSKKQLTDAEKRLLQQWIDQGAEYKLHWAFVPLQRPTPPPVKDKAWPNNAIDHFILERLEKAGLRPSPRADKATLIRRLSFDLRGLPPTLAEVDAFLADENPNAYAKLVEQFLASPHFGEKLALLWLDLARFGDTSGFHLDSTRQMWLWRDWVIDAFNKNMPYDQFTIEQLAGDLLPNPTVAQKIASGFNRNTRFNEEGGVDPEEYVVRYNVERASTLGSVWLGLTLGCAECHSHKYDPISQQEFYQMYAFFTGIREPMISMNHNEPLPPLLKVPSPEQEKTLAALTKEKGETEAYIRKKLGMIRYTEPGEKRPEESLAFWEQHAHKNPKLPKDLQAALKVERAERSPIQQSLLLEYFLRKVHPDTVETFGPLDQELDELLKKIKAVEDAIPHTMISEEMEKPRPAYVLHRGDFQHKGEKVDRAVPAVFPPFSKDQPLNRLGLARWLMHPEHPLTARVAVNRFWAQMFGSGLVRTMGDFGAQGDFPSHPELLDWLALEFMQPTKEGSEVKALHPWNIKHVFRTIALSAAYQQSSAFPEEMPKGDPHNRLLSRAPRFRLSAEEVRDNALAVSGLLSRKIGGPSVMPYQPFEFYKGKYENWPWKTSAGEDQYRRGMYTFWRRTSLHPMFALFDAPGREDCTVARPRTNTPLQALVTLNDPTFVEAARVFAQRLMSDGPVGTDARITLAFRTALARPPSAAEIKICQLHLEKNLTRFRADRDAASKLVHAGQYTRLANLDIAEHAAWTTVASMILNVDEFIMRE